jgi:PAS domain S-box-containing protein
MKKSLELSTKVAESPLVILIVDDIPENLILLEDVFGEHDLRTVSASNGVEALKIMERETVHIIVSDAMMPKMDGFQLCKIVKNNPASSAIPFIIYTSDYIDEEDKDLAKNIGVDKYVLKSGSNDELVGVVKQLIQKTYSGGKKYEAPEAMSLDEYTFIERHDKILIKKLEEKMMNLEEYSLQLLHKNDELHRSELRYRLLFEHASIPIFVLDANGEELLDVNTEAVNLLGYQRDELLAMKKLPFAESDIQPALIFEQEFSGEFTVTSKENKIICFEATASLIDFDKEKRILLIAHDVTEKKIMLEKIFQTEKLSLLGTVAAGIAHEVRNPLAGVKLNLQFLEQKYGEAHPDIETLRLAIEGTKHIEKVIENTLNIARTTAPEIHYDMINDVLTQSLNLLMLTIHKKRISIETNLTNDLPQIKMDSKQIMQVVLNILRNAIEATPENGIIVINSNYELPDEIVASRIVVTIRDSGAGISQEYLKNAFELFRTTKNAGTGLGLALSKRIMNQHNGEIRIAAVPEGGTEVQLIFLQKQ